MRAAALSWNSEDALRLVAARTLVADNGERTDPAGHGSALS
ncbi:hypothetical protein [Streptomyces sp. NPDC056821]